MLGSIAQGLTRGMAASNERKERAEERALRKKMVDLQMQQMKYKMQQQQMRNQWLERMVGEAGLGKTEELKIASGAGEMNQGPQIAKRPEESVRDMMPAPQSELPDRDRKAVGDLLDMMISGQSGSTDPAIQSMVEPGGYPTAMGERSIWEKARAFDQDPVGEFMRSNPDFIEGIARQFGVAPEEAARGLLDRMMRDREAKRQSQQPPMSVQPQTMPTTPQQGGMMQKIGKMNPNALAAMSELLGVDLLGAARLSETRRSNALRENQYIAEDTEVPGVGTVRTYRQKYGPPPSLSIGQGAASAGAMGGPKLMTPSKGNMPIEEQNLGFWIDPSNLNSPAYGMTPNQATKKGYVRVTSNDKSKINDFKGVQALARKLEAQAHKVFPKTGGVYDKYIGGATRTLGAMLETNPDARILKDMIDGTIAAFVRMYEKGTLTDEDIVRAKKMHISLGNSSDVVWKKIEGLKELIKDSQNSFLGRSGYSKQPGKSAGSTSRPQSVDNIKAVYNQLRDQGLSKEEAYEELRRRGFVR